MSLLPDMTTQSTTHKPFKIEGPAVISFSGGRTSGYMLWRILQAHDGVLPADVRVVFANTGKEMNETLDFVQACSDEWHVPIDWVEYRAHEVPQQRWHQVNYATASRDGEPFRALIQQKSYLPNPVARFCTIEMKIRSMKLYAQQALGFTHWDVVIGFRADEPARVAKLTLPNREPFERLAPLATVGITAGDVGLFWKAQSFDLMLPNTRGVTMHGNCDLCFLKGSNQILSLIREQPSRALWWIKTESMIQSSGQALGDGSRFRKDRPSYQRMYDMATTHGEMFAFDNEALQDCACTD